MNYLDIGSYEFYQTEFYLSYFDTSGHLTENKLHMCDKNSSKECLFVSDWIDININKIYMGDELKCFYDDTVYMTETIATNILLDLGATKENIKYLQINLDNVSSKIKSDILLHKFIWKCNVYIEGENTFIINAEICDIKTKDKDKEIVEFDNLRICISI